MPGPLAIWGILKATERATKTAKKTSGGRNWFIGIGLVAAAICLVLVFGLAQAIASGFFPVINNGANPNQCQQTVGGDYTLPDGYSYQLPAWDGDPNKRQQTRNPNVQPGAVPERYNNRGTSVPYKAYLDAAQAKYNVPWFMLAAISWQETKHGADANTWNRNANPDHSYGPMQFIPGTFATYGVDGDDDGTVSDESVGDLIFAAANLLVRNGFLEGQDGVLRAIRAYNPHETYKNDVLFWAQRYAAGAGDPATVNNQFCNSLDSGQIAKVVEFVLKQYELKKPYVWGAEGPDAFDCSGLMWAAYRTVGVTLPRTASQQSDGEQIDIVASRRVNPDILMPGDLLFFDNGSGREQYSSRLKVYIGHVAMFIGRNEKGEDEVVQASSPSVGITRTVFDAADWNRVAAAGRVKGMVQAGGATGPWVAPVRSALPTSPYGTRTDPASGQPAFHSGLDLAAPCGTPIYAVADGVVIFAGPASGYGNYIVIDHGGGFHTGYGHEQALHVENGQPVKRGQHIADVGNFGSSFGCHLHFNTLLTAYDGPWSGTYEDPQPLLQQHGVNYWG